MSIIRYFMQKIGLNTQILHTEEYASEHVDIHPKRPDTILRDLGLDRPYYQVFASKFGFKPNLSVMDLLFNEGPGALDWLL